MKLDYERLQRAYAYGKPDAGLLLEEMLREAVRISGPSDKGLGSCARYLVSAMEAGKAERARELDKEAN